MGLIVEITTINCKFISELVLNPNINITCYITTKYIKLKPN